ncbi:MAG: universal stress protein E [Verrucomicrobiales bacterium]|jgi:universal stress protein E
MNRFKSILFVYCGNSDANLEALRQALELAETNRGKVSVLTVLKRLPEDWHYKIPLERYLKEQVEADVRKVVTELGGPLSAVPDIAFVGGEPFIEIVGQVMAHGYDLVIKATETVSEKRIKGFPTTDMRILRKCPCPLWLFRGANKREHPLRILAAIDPDLERPASDPMARLILELASSLRERTNGVLEILHCWELEYEDAMRHSPFLRVSEESLDEQIQKMEALHTGAIAKATSDFATHPSTSISTIKGNPADVILRKAVEDGVDLIVMGTVARTGIQGLFIGNTAESILTQVECSVLTLKPEGFVIPVAPSKSN